METPLGIIDLDALPPMNESELMKSIKKELSALPEADQTEILEIMEDLFTEDELKAMSADDFSAGEMGLN